MIRLLVFTRAAMLDFDETIRVPQNFQLGNSVEVHAR